MAQLDDAFNPNRAGVAIGSGIGGLDTIVDNQMNYIHHGAKRISPYFIPRCIVNMAAGLVSIEHGFKGVNYCMSTGANRDK